MDEVREKTKNERLSWPLRKVVQQRARGGTLTVELECGHESIMSHKMRHARRFRCRSCAGGLTIRELLTARLHKAEAAC